MERLRRSDAGMTLIELMFACGILAMALSMIFGSLIGISVVGRLSESRTAATTTLASLIEDIQSMSFNELIAYVPPPVEGPGVSHTVEVACVVAGEANEEGLDDEVATVPLPIPSSYEGPLPNPLEVRVTLTWHEANGFTFQATASTLRGR